MKIKMLKLANAIQVGSDTITVARSDLYDIELEDKLFLRITHKTKGAQSLTSIMNMVYCLPDETLTPAQPIEVAPKRGRVVI